MVDLDKLLQAGADQEMTVHRISDELSLEDKDTLKDALLLSAHCKAMITEVDRCSKMLRHLAMSTGLHKVPKHRAMSLSHAQVDAPFKGIEVGSDAARSIRQMVDEINPTDEQPDYDLFEDEEMGTLEPFKGVILPLLSRLSLGMDLSRVILPTFILQSRSFLESLSNHFAIFPMLLELQSERTTALQRFLSVVKWYLASMRYGTQNGLSKKPYNPILGEIFRCSWQYTPPEPDAAPIRAKFIAEQVSHHPPVSAFFFACPAKDLHVWGHVWPRSKFMGMSLQCNCAGEMVVHLGGDKNEIYRFSPFPTAYARSILTNPWMEMAGRISVTCKKTSISGNITFHSKPFYGGKCHHFTAEVKSAVPPRPPGNGNDAERMLCKLEGEWDSNIHVLQPDGVTSMSSSLSVPDDLPVAERLIRPLDQQHPRESRKLWREATQRLRAKDLENATAAKTRLEDLQRAQSVRMKEQSLEHVPQYFNKSQDGVWVCSQGPVISDDQ